MGKARLCILVKGKIIGEELKVWWMVQDVCAWTITIWGKLGITITGFSASSVIRIISSLVSATCGAPAGTTPVRVSGSASSSANMPVDAGGISLRFSYPPHEEKRDLDIARCGFCGRIRTLNIIRAIDRDSLLATLRLTVVLIQEEFWRYSKVFI